MIKNEFYIIEIDENIITDINAFGQYITERYSINNVINAIKFSNISDAEDFIETNKKYFLEEISNPTIIKINLNIKLKEEEIKEIDVLNL